MAKDRMVITIEAEAGSSLLDVTIENADPAQLFAAAGILAENARIAFAGQLAHSMRGQASPLEVVKSPLPGRN